MTSHRYPYCANTNWNFEKSSDGMISSEDCKLIILMDIREELKMLNTILRCNNTLSIPRFLKKIELNTRKKKAKR